jgi:hypothetical protein
MDESKRTNRAKPQYLGRLESFLGVSITDESWQLGGGLPSGRRRPYCSREDVTEPVERRQSKSNRIPSVPVHRGVKDRRADGMAYNSGRKFLPDSPLAVAVILCEYLTTDRICACVEKCSGSGRVSSNSRRGRNHARCERIWRPVETGRRTRPPFRGRSSAHEPRLALARNRLSQMNRIPLAAFSRARWPIRPRACG